MPPNSESGRKGDLQQGINTLSFYSGHLIDTMRASSVYAVYTFLGGGHGNEHCTRSSVPPRRDGSVPHVDWLLLHRDAATR